MGIKGLKKIIAEVQKDISISSFKNKVIYVDMSIWLHKFLHTTDSDDDFLEDVENQAKFLLKHGIIPEYVFDGASNPEVKIVSVQRAEDMKNKLQSLDKINEAIIKGELPEESLILLEAKKNSLENATKKMPKNIKQKCKNILRSLNIKCRQATFEADTLIAHLCATEQGYAVFTEDLDMLTYGCARVITGVSTTNDSAKMFELADVLGLLKMTQKMFVDFCILCGCDYATKIKFIGPVKAREYIQKCKTIEALIEVIRKNNTMSARHTWNDVFLIQVERARNMFIRRSPTVEPILLEFDEDIITILDEKILTEPTIPQENSDEFIDTIVADILDITPEANTSRANNTRTSNINKINLNTNYIIDGSHSNVISAISKNIIITPEHIPLHTNVTIISDGIITDIVKNVVIIGDAELTDQELLDDLVASFEKSTNITK